MRQNAHPWRLLTMASITAAWLFGSMTLPKAIMARPGTPAELTAYVEDHRRIRFAFRNAASEPVIFNFDILVNGIQSPQNIQHMNCGSPDETDMECRKVMFPQQPFIYRGQQLYVFSNQMGANSRVCLRVIAREWNNGNPQSGLVSDQWSSWACGTMKPPPNPPSVPAAPQLQYLPPAAARGLPGQVRLSGTYPVPRFSTSHGRFDFWSITQKWLNGAWHTVDLKPAAGAASSWPLVDDGVAQPTPTNILRYRVCAANDGGAQCSSGAQVYSIVSVGPPTKGPATLPGNIGIVAH